MSSGSKTAKTESDQSGQSTWAPHQATAPGYGFLAGNTTNLMQQPVPYFPGQTYVGPSQMTQQGIGGIQEGAAGMGNILNQGNQNFGFLSGAADVQNNPYVQGMIEQNNRAGQRQLSERLLPQLQQGAIGVNALGSDRLGLAQGQAVGDVAADTANRNAQMQLQAYGQGLGAQQGALGQMGNVMQNQLAPGMAQLGGGQTVEDYQGKALQDAMSRFAYQYQEPWQRMQNVGGTLGFLQPLGTQSSTGAAQGQAPNPNYSSPLQTAMGIGAIAAPFFSDRRLKRNIQRTGTTPGGYPTHRWTYVDGTPGEGVMADEVPQDWVVKHSSGYDMVDYSKVV